MSIFLASCGTKVIVLHSELKKGILNRAHAIGEPAVFTYY